MKVTTGILFCILGVFLSLFSGYGMAKAGRREGQPKATVSRTRKESLAFLEREQQFSGKLVLQPYDTEDQAHLAASERYLDASVLTKREVAWRVYKKDDQFFFTYPVVGKEGSKFVGLPKKATSEGYDFVSAGHTHFDGNYHFSGQDWRLVTQEKKRGHGIKLYLANAKGNVKKLTPKMARKRWSKNIQSMMAKSWSGRSIASI